ncbi:MAG TPA: histidine kinase dimerization/phospho-acceptor domain-containing protein [Bryobacteraceae bacterium]|jgi:signal transduction histidine kinase
MDPERLLASVVHDLREPLSTIDGSAFCLNMLLGESDSQAALQVSIIQRQIEEATRVLSAAADALRRPYLQAAEEENLDLTKSEIAAVT